MRTKSKWAMNGAAAGALALLLATPAFAQSRGDWNRNDSNRSTQNGEWNGNDSNRGTQNDQRNHGDSNRNTQNERLDNNNGGYRENQRVNVSGNVTSFNRERDGYRVQLDRGRDSYWVPEATFGRRARDLRAGLSISLGGVFRGGTIYVDAVNWPDNGYGRGGSYDSGFVRGVVDRIDYRSGTIWLRDDRSGRVIAAETSRRDLRDVRRGDFVELSGQWIRGSFEVARIDNVRGRRY